MSTQTETASGASLTYPVQAGSLKKGGHVVIKGRPCKVVEISTSKTGKHGHAKANIVGIDIFTGKKYEDVCPTTHNLEAPVLKREDYTLSYIDDDGFLILLDKNNEEKTDIKLPENEIGQAIRKAYDEEKDLEITILSAMGIEGVERFKEI